MAWFFERGNGLSRERVEALIDQTVREARTRLCAKPRRVLLLPPDITRAHSGAGWITERFYSIFAQEAEVYVMPTLGQHLPHTEEQNQWMFGSIPEERILAHDWIADGKRIGVIPADYVESITEGKANWEIPVNLNRRLMEESWDLIINIGHVVPHEVLGFANHNKNYFIGLAGKDLICTSHMASASYGIENNLGTLVTPVRECFNKAEDDYLRHLPDLYVQVTMRRNEENELVHTGVYVGDDLDTYLDAARQSREENITVLDKPLEKVVCVMQGDEFFSTWVANKAVYRTRMAIADGGELVVIAPGLKRFGEQPEVDELIRKVGYVGTPRVMEAYRTDPLLQDFAHGTAHLIHGSSEGRFRITYAPGHMTREEIEGVNFGYADIGETIARYRPDTLREGFNEIDGERFFFIPTPSAGLWSTREKLYSRAGAT